MHFLLYNGQTTECLLFSTWIMLKLILMACTDEIKSHRSAVYCINWFFILYAYLLWCSDILQVGDYPERDPFEDDEIWAHERGVSSFVLLIFAVSISLLHRLVLFYLNKLLVSSKSILSILCFCIGLLSGLYICRLLFHIRPILWILCFEMQQWFNKAGHTVRQSPVGGHTLPIGYPVWFRQHSNLNPIWMKPEHARPEPDLNCKFPNWASIWVGIWNPDFWVW